MTTTRTAVYRRHYRTEGLSLVLRANFSEASSPIAAAWVKSGESIAEDDWRWFSTPYQVADARHSPDKAFGLIRNWRG